MPEGYEDIKEPTHTALRARKIELDGLDPVPQQKRRIGSPRQLSYYDLFITSHTPELQTNNTHATSTSLWPCDVSVSQFTEGGNSIGILVA